MPKIIKLKESDIHRMVKMVLNEQTTSSLRNMKILPVCDSKMKCKGELHVVDLKLEQGTDKECKVKFKYRLIINPSEYPNAASIPIPKQGVGEKSCVRTGKKGKRSWNLKTDGYILNKGTGSPYYFPSWDTERGDFDTMCGTCKPNEHGPYRGQSRGKEGRYEGGKKVGELNEQTPLLNLARTVRDPSNIGIDDYSTDLSSLRGKPTTPQEKVKELFKKAGKMGDWGGALLPEETLNRLESDAKKLKAAMDGAGINGTEVKRILNSIKNKNELNHLLIFFECGDLNPNKDCGNSLYNWFAGEYTISWNTIWKALESRFKKDVRTHQGKMV